MPFPARCGTHGRGWAAPCCAQPTASAVPQDVAGPGCLLEGEHMTRMRVSIGRWLRWLVPAMVVVSLLVGGLDLNGVSGSTGVGAAPPPPQPPAAASPGSTTDRPPAVAPLACSSGTNKTGDPGTGY